MNKHNTNKFNYQFSAEHQLCATLLASFNSKKPFETI